MTNYEKIKSMSVEEMAKFMFFVADSRCENICKSKGCDVFWENLCQRDKTLA